MALTRRPSVLLLLLVGLLAVAAALSCAHAARVPAALHHQDYDDAAAHQGQAPAPAPVQLERAVDEQAPEHASEEVMSLSFGGGSRSGGGSGGSRSSGGGGSRGGGSRSGGGSRGGSRSGCGSRSGGSKGTTFYGAGYDWIMDDDDYSAAGGRGGVWKSGVAATVLAGAWLLQL